MKTTKLVLSFLLIVAMGSNAKSTNYFVSNSGSNSNNGLSTSNAFLTIQRAADLVVAGDAVFVEDGIYAGFDLRAQNGTSTNPILFKGTGSSVLINTKGPEREDGINIEEADYVIIDGFICDDMINGGNGIRIVLSDHCIVRNCACDNNCERGIFTAFTDDILIENNVCTNSVDEHGIYVSNSSDRPIIRFNECYGNNNIGIHLNGDLSSGGDGIISDAQIYGNIIYDNKSAAGINMDGLENPEVYNNLIYNNHLAQGIALFQEDGAIMTSGAKIYNNTIIVPPNGRWGILIKNGGNVDTEIYNNIIINQHASRGCIAVENITDFTSDFNVLNNKMSASGDGSAITLTAWKALGFDANSLLADPLTDIFENPATNDYHLISSSQAIDVGTSLVNSLVTFDLEGDTRPYGASYDIGVYEYSVPLAVIYLEELRAKVIDDRVKLSWSTASENNSEYFEIERTNDRKNWQKIKKINAQNNTNTTTTYSSMDVHPLEGTSYYRLKQIDFDGSFSYSNIVSVDFLKMNFEVYPNPTTGNLILSFSENTKRTVIVSNLIGRTLLEVEIVDFEQKLDLINFENGIYWISIFERRNLLGREMIIKN